jgi:hypothetical protein
MADRLLVATRKGLFQFARKHGTYEIARRSFVGEPVTMMLHDPRDGALYAALDLGHFGAKLHRSDDDGGTWEEIAVPSYEHVAGDPAPALKLVWSLETGAPGEMWAGTIPGGLFKSADRGATWMLNEPLWSDPLRAQWFGGGYDHPGIHSISVDPRDVNRIAIAVSCGGVWLTEDGGKNWRVSTEGMFATYTPPEERENSAIQDPHRLVRCAGAPDIFWVQHHNGMFRSADGAETWASLDGEPSSFGFAVGVHPRDPDTAWFATAVKDEKRYPVDGRLVVSRTRDGGETFELLSKGLPSAESYDLIYRHGLDVDETGARVAMGSTTGNLWVSEDGGDEWRELSAHLPPIYAVRFA